MVYAAMWVGYRQQWGWLHDFDWALLNAGHETGSSTPCRCNAGMACRVVLGPVPLRWIGVAATVAALVQRNVRAALVLFACRRCSADLSRPGAKDLANRPRPSTMLVSAPSSSFPSGHALEATSVSSRC